MSSAILSTSMNDRGWAYVNTNDSNVWSIKTGLHDIVLQQQQRLHRLSLSYSSGLTHHALNLQARKLGI
jgi:hypothetical protein